MTCLIELQWDKQLENGISNFYNDQKNDYSQIRLVVKYMFWCCGGNKYLTISQHDDSYTTLDKMRHLLVIHYVRNDV